MLLLKHICFYYSPTYNGVLRVSYFCKLHTRIPNKPILRAFDIDGSKKCLQKGNNHASQKGNFARNKRRLASNMRLILLSVLFIIHVFGFSRMAERTGFAFLNDETNKKSRGSFSAEALLKSF